MNFSRISAEKAKTLLAKADTNSIDIRDEQSFQLGLNCRRSSISIQPLHCRVHAKADKSKTLIVCCYHGNSSQSAAQFFVEQSFQEVYSRWWFEHWRTLYPQDCTQGKQEIGPIYFAALPLHQGHRLSPSNLMAKFPSLAVLPD